MNKKKTNVCFVLLLLLGLGQMTWGAWTMRRLTYDPEFSEAPCIATNGENIYVAWHKYMEGNAEIFFRKSTTDGTSWEASKRLTYNEGESKNPAIAVQGANIYVVWDDDTPGETEIYFRKSADGGSTWQSVRRLTYNAGNSEFPKIAVYGAAIYVVWMDLMGNWEVYFRKSTDGGSTWQSVRRLTYSEVNSIWPCVAADAANVYLAWGEGSPVDAEIYFRKSTDGGSTWKISKRLTYNAETSEKPRIAINGANVYIVWDDYSSDNWDAEIFFRRSTDSGANWKSTLRLSYTRDGWGGYYGAWHPDIAVKGTNLYVAWTSMLASPGNRDDIYFKKSVDSGTTWQPVVQLTDNSGFSYRPAIAVNDTNVYVTWDDDTPLNAEIFVKFSPK